MEFGKFGGKTKVAYSVPFRPEWRENLVPVCKPVQGNPSFHLGLNFGVFRVISGVSDHFGRFTFWGIFFLSPLGFSDLFASNSRKPASQPSLQRSAGHSSLLSPALSPSLQQSSLSLSSELTASSLQQGRRLFKAVHLRPANKKKLLVYIN